MPTNHEIVLLIDGLRKQVMDVLAATMLPPGMHARLSVVFADATLKAATVGPPAVTQPVAAPPKKPSARRILPKPTLPLKPKAGKRG